MTDGIRGLARRASQAAPCLVILLYLTLALLYNVSVPLWEAPEEALHFDYVRYLVQQRSLPPLPDPAVGPPPGGVSEARQPPLYYLVGALAVSWVDMGSAPTWHRNPYVTWEGHPAARAIALHGEDETFPYSGVALAAHLVRLVSSLMGMVAVVCGFLIARTVLGDRTLAVGASAVTALTPGFLFTTSTVNNDNAPIMFGSLLVLASVRALKDDSRWGALALAWIFAFLTGISKDNGLYAIPFVLLVTAIAAFRKLRISWKRALLIVAIGISAAIGVGVVLPDVVHSALARAGYMSPQSLPLATANATPARVIGFFPGFFATYWGDFGWQNVPFDLWQYFAVLGFCAAALLGLVRYLGTSNGWRTLGTAARLSLVMLATGILLLFYIIFLRHLVRASNIAGFYQHARYYFPMIAGTSLFLVLGLGHLALRRGGRSSLPTAGFLVVLFALAVSGPLYYIPSAYPPRVPIRSALDPAVDRRNGARFENGIALAGISGLSETYEPGGTIQASVYWQALRNNPSDRVASLQVLDRRSAVLAVDDRVPLAEVLPPSRWGVGYFIRDERRLEIPPATPPGLYSLEAVVYDFATMEREPATSSSTGSKQNSVVLGVFRVTPHPIEANAIERRQDALFGDAVKLLGYTLRKPAEGELGVILFWQRQRPIAIDYTVSVQLLDRDGRLAAQHDGQPVEGDYPTSLWHTDEIVRDEHTLTMPNERAAPEYTLQVIVYSGHNFERLPVSKMGEVQPGDQLVLQSVGP